MKTTHLLPIIGFLSLIARPAFSDGPPYDTQPVGGAKIVVHTEFKDLDPKTGKYVYSSKEELYRISNVSFASTTKLAVAQIGTWQGKSLYAGLLLLQFPSNETATEFRNQLLRTDCLEYDIDDSDIENICRTTFDVNPFPLGHSDFGLSTDCTQGEYNVSPSVFMARACSSSQ
jgi:hypothetical protein